MCDGLLTEHVEIRGADGKHHCIAFGWRFPVDRDRVASNHRQVPPAIVAGVRALLLKTQAAGVGAAVSGGVAELRLAIGDGRGGSNRSAATGSSGAWHRQEAGNPQADEANGSSHVVAIPPPRCGGWRRAVLANRLAGIGYTIFRSPALNAKLPRPEPAWPPSPRTTPSAKPRWSKPGKTSGRSGTKPSARPTARACP